MSRLSIVLNMIKFEHTVFALPFAFLGAVLAARGFPGWWPVVWIGVAMVGARSAAMAFNRLADHSFDALNPRTAGRALPQGQVGRSFVGLFVAASTALFVLACWMLNPLALALSPLAIAIILVYSFTKRFTSLTHLFLGLALAVAPVGGWVAVTGRISWEPFLLAGAVLFWVGGFDIVYACQDLEFDRRQGLFSLPRKVGVTRALWLAVVFHLFMVGLLAWAFLYFELSVLGWAGLALTAAGLIYEHSLVSAHDLSRVNAAFFTVNGFISVTLFLFVGLDLWLLR